MSAVIITIDATGARATIAGRQIVAGNDAARVEAIARSVAASKGRQIVLRQRGGA